MMKVGAALIAVAVLYLGLDGEIAPSELIADGGVTLAAALLFVVLQRARTRDLSLRPRWPRLLGRTALALCRDTAAVAWALGRAAARGGATSGIIALQPFDAGPDTPAVAGRRALVTLTASLAPNGYVLRLLEKRQALAIHRLSWKATDLDREWPN